MDECSNGACGYTEQKCVNSAGSFECQCIKGFNYVDGNSVGEDMCEGNKLVKTGKGLGMVIGAPIDGVNS